jgi:hypothetical protein
VTFNETNWYQWQDVYVLPVTGDGFDGQDFKCFAVQPSLVQGIQGMHNACTHPQQASAVMSTIPIHSVSPCVPGPIILDGASDPTFDDKIPEPIAYPGELDALFVLQGYVPSRDIIEENQIDTLLVFNLDGKLVNPAFGARIGDGKIQGLKMGAARTIGGQYVSSLGERLAGADWTAQWLHSTSLTRPRFTLQDVPRRDPVQQHGDL